MLQLALECLKPDEFEVQNSHTTLDAPQTVYHIREVFKRLEEKGIKTFIFNSPTPDQSQLTIWDLMLKQKYPPTRLARYCCASLKECTTPNRLVAIGVRADESNGRKNRDVFGIKSKEKATRYYYSLDHVKEVFEEAIEDAQDQKVPLNTISPWDCTFIRKAKEKKEEMVNPIYDWTEKDVWDFIEDRHIKVCDLYAMGYKRVGCVGCPLGGRNHQQTGFADFPKYAQAMRKTIDRIFEKRKAEGKADTWQSGEEMWLWWTQDPEYMKAHPSPYQLKMMKEREAKRAAREAKKAEKERIKAENARLKAEAKAKKAEEKKNEG